MESEGLTRLIVPGTDSDVADAYATLAERASNAVFGFEDEIAFVDIETTGFSSSRDAIIEVAAVIAKGPQVLDRFSMLVDPGRPVPPEIVELTGIDDAMLKGAPPPEAVGIQLAEFVDGRDIVAHNASFDRGFLIHAAGETRFRGAWLDSVQLALIALPRLRNHRLHDLALAFGAHTPSHRASDDAEALAHLWRVLLVALSDLPAPLLHHLSHLAPDADWPLRAVISHIAAGKGSAGAGAFDLKDVRRSRTVALKADVLADAAEIECACPPTAEIASEFSAEGIAGCMYDGFERREEQERMASAVLEAFGERKHAAIEAGTGVGKSVAYLVPAARFAQLNKVGVGVATKTNALMDQLIYSELPALCSALDEPLLYVALKGYEHYPCLRKVDRLAAELDEAAEERQVTAVAAMLTWAVQSSWGDLDAINIHWTRDLRGAVGASVADCTYRRCRYYPNLCYLHGVRRRAASAHIVVTNHALLFRDLVSTGGILPPLRHWVIDEAHSAEAEARKQLTVGTSHLELASALSALHGTGRGGVLGGLRRVLRGHPLADPASTLAEIDRMENDSATAVTLTASLFDFVKDLGELVEESGYDICEMRISPELRERGPWGSIDGVGRSLAKRLYALIESGRRLMLLLEEAGADLVSERADLAGALSRIAEQHDGLVTVLDGEDEAFVYSAYLDRRRHVTPERLTAALVDVGDTLCDHFFPEIHASVFTSATIATGEDFSHFARTIGLDRLAEDQWDALRLESSYDFERQMTVFIPNDLGDPRSEHYRERLEHLLRDVHLAMGGSVLTLFTNRREMDGLYRVLEPDLKQENLRLLVQSRGVSAKRLRDEFIAEPTVSLFATKSFWEGFDAKGDTLRCVVVPRLPFGRPTDPLAEERQQREGGAAWRRYALPEAVIALKQAAGRLIRSSTDTGCLVISDARVLTKGYGKEFLASLPVRDVEVVSSADLTQRVRERFGAE